MGGSLYQKIEKECEAYMSAALKSLVGQSEDLVVFLSLVQKCWHDFCDQMLMIRGIALHLDCTYVKQTSNVRSLLDTGLQLFHKHISLASGGGAQNRVWSSENVRRRETRRSS
ncbi:Cullin-4 [Castilleja foliolosa]|uniref:Cullin-4 n=1 Tax=Castilleja foliolosa TaxID=1961234 RepID=A0ABD3C4S5_9LAMI